MLNVIIFGPPGSGKGTQGVKIAEKYGLAHVSTGDLLRKEIETNTHFGTIVKGYIDKGELVPDATIIEILDSYVDKLPVGQGIIFDGFPRTVEQAQSLMNMMAEHNAQISILVDLEVERQELIDRIVLRGKTSGRSDDNAETVEKRLAVYDEKTKPAVDFFDNLKLYKKIDGNGTIDEIFGRLCDAIDAVK